jgi:hypothetical protein
MRFPLRLQRHGYRDEYRVEIAQRLGEKPLSGSTPIEIAAKGQDVRKEISKVKVCPAADEGW